MERWTDKPLTSAVTKSKSAVSTEGTAKQTSRNTIASATATAATTTTTTTISTAVATSNTVGVNPDSRAGVVWAV